MRVIELQDEEAAALTAKAMSAGLTLGAWLKELASTEGNQPPAETTVGNTSANPAPRRRHISETIREIMRDVPPWRLCRRTARASTIITSMARLSATYDGCFR